MTVPQISSLFAIVPAAGIGTRMRSDVPKQYLPLLGKTVIEHSLERLLQLPHIATVVVALHPQDHWFAQLPIAAHPRVTRVMGGAERVDSVLAALQTLPNEGWVMVHDAARPCVPVSDLQALLDTCALPAVAGAILATPVRDTMKRAHLGSAALPQIDTTVAREQLWHALTPQCFPVRALRDAIINGKNAGVQMTDEASAMEAQGAAVALVNASPSNIKITYPDDLILASFYLQHLLQQEMSPCV